MATIHCAISARQPMNNGPQYPVKFGIAAQLLGFGLLWISRQPPTHGRLNIVRRIRTVYNLAIGDRLGRITNVSPVDVGSKILDAYGAVRRFFDLDRKGLVTPTLLVDDLPEVGHRCADRLGERLAFGFAQSLEVRVKVIHGSNDSICFR